MNRSTNSPRLQRYVGRLTACISSIPLVWKPWFDPRGRRGRCKAGEQRVYVVYGTAPAVHHCLWERTQIKHRPDVDAVEVVRTLVAGRTHVRIGSIEYRNVFDLRFRRGDGGGSQVFEGTGWTAGRVDHSWSWPQLVNHKSSRPKALSELWLQKPAF